jgi:hypothetical protein
MVILWFLYWIKNGAKSNELGFSLHPPTSSTFRPTLFTEIHKKTQFDKKEADLSDLSEVNRENITAPAIRKIRKIRFPYYF